MTHIFWDLDGTLLSTGGKGWPCMLKAAGAVSAVESPSSMSGLSDFQILRKLTGRATGDLETAMSKYLECLQRSLKLGDVEPFHEAARALRALDKAGFQNVIVTGNHSLGARIKLAAAKYSSDIMQLKIFGSLPGREDRFSISKFAMSELSLRRAIFVGDSTNDVEAALKHGLPCVAVATGHHTVEQLKSANPAVTLRRSYNWEELVSAIKTLDTIFLF